MMPDSAPVPAEHAAPDRPPELILAIDCGSTATRAFLLGRVEGEYRLIAAGLQPASLDPPWNDMMASVRQAVAQISEITGWPLLEENGRILKPGRIGSGVDAVVAVTSAGEPLRLVLAGVAREERLAQARSALTSAHALIAGVIASDGDADRVLGKDLAGQVRLIQQLAPEAVVMLGDADAAGVDSVLESARSLGVVLSTLNGAQPAGARPTVIYAGAADLLPQVTRIVGPAAHLQAVRGLHPKQGLDLEEPGALQEEVSWLARQKMERMPGYGVLAGWSTSSVLPAITALAQSIEYLARLQQINVLGIDLGGTTSKAVAFVDGRPDLALRADLGLGRHAAAILEQGSIQSVQRWLPLRMQPGEVEDALFSKAVRPHTLPQTQRDLLLEQAVAREILRLVAADLAGFGPPQQGSGNPGRPRLDLIIGGGGVLASAPDHGQAALMLLDGLQPVGISHLALDRLGLVAPLSAVARLNPAAAAQVMGQDAILSLGTVVAPVGAARQGQIVLACRVTFEDGRSVETEVAYGSLQVIPLPAGQTATLEIGMLPNFDFGAAGPGPGGEIEVQGGAVGILIDARGRPLSLAKDPDEQRERMGRWLAEVAT